MLNNAQNSCQRTHLQHQTQQTKLITFLTLAIHKYNAYGYPTDNRRTQKLREKSLKGLYQQGATYQILVLLGRHTTLGLFRGYRHDGCKLWGVNATSTTNYNNTADALKKKVSQNVVKSSSSPNNLAN